MSERDSNTPVRTEEEQGFYRVELSANGQPSCQCSNCQLWTVTYDDGEPTEIHTSWQGEAGREAAEDVCDLMNMAYDLGREKLEPVLKLASELCDAIDAEEADVGGHRRARDILGELGPAVEAAK